VTKPFSLDEVVARVRAVLRRAGTAAAMSRRSFADITLDDDLHEVRRNGVVVDLTVTEYNLLRFLMDNPRRVVSRAQILDHVWHDDFDGDDTVVPTYISYLRRKLDPLGPPLIHTIRGVGYSLRLPRSENAAG
jgi:two-component system OmpR family response regulator